MISNKHNKQKIDNANTIGTANHKHFFSFYHLFFCICNCLAFVSSIILTLFIEKNAGTISDIDKESKTLKMLNHKNIIKLYQAFVVKNELLLIMEYADGGEMIEYVEEKKGLDEVECRSLFR